MALNTPIRCFIFDLDGTLVFNEEANFLAYQAAFKKVGLSLSKEEYHSYFGLGVEEMLQLYCSQHRHPFTTELLNNIKSHKSNEYIARLDHIEQNAAIVGLLSSLAPHYHTALATTAREQNGHAVLSNFGLDKYFDFMVFGEHVSQKKPSPECYHKIAQHFNVTPEECIIFEDSPVGLQAATAFGGHICKVVR